MTRIYFDAMCIAALCFAGLTGTARGQDNDGAVMTVHDRSGGDDNTITIPIHDIGSIRFDPCNDIIVRYNNGPEQHIDPTTYGALKFVPCEQSNGPGGKPRPVPALLPGATPSPSGLLVALHPNPTSSSLVIEITSDQSDRASIAIYDLSGNPIWTREPIDIPAGTTRITWSGATSAGIMVSSGTYVVRVTTPGRESTEYVNVTK
ncbi:MAG: FlgD Ig-like domain [Chlorobi bacterium]|nr:FlgD Ig-like domain [Chlorobiota bacterium]